MTRSLLRLLPTALLAIAAVSFMPPAVSPAHAAPAAGLPDFTDLVDKVGPAVVNIRTTTRVPAPSDTLPPGAGRNDLDELFRRFFGIPLLPPRPGGPAAPPCDQGDNGGADAAPERNAGVGSGFVLSADGYVMTNAHVVDDADSIYVTLTDKREFKAKLIGIDERTDVAVVKIDAANLPTVTIGDSDRVRVGEWVVAIGSPFGLDNTVTAGIVSAKGRDTGDYLPFIQTDVAVNPGNSGGPLINMQGEVIGVNSQIYSRTGGFMGISFAIPIDEAMRVAEQLKANGKVTRGRIAVAIGEVPKDVAESLGLPQASGALVSTVEPGGPADRAGVKPGDIITRFGGKPVDAATDLPRMVGETKPGSRTTVTVWRKGQTATLPIVVEETSDKSPKQAGKRSPPAPAPHAANALGIAASDIPPDQLKALKVSGGVLVDSVGGPAARAGLQKGDVVLRVGDTDVVNVKQFDALVRALDPSKLVAVLVRRGDATQFVTMRPQASKP